MSAIRPCIVWFRQDLRLDDNPALAAAAGRGAPVLPIYVLDDAGAGSWALGSASRWWLHHSLAALDAALDGRLLLLAGRGDEILPDLACRVGAEAVLWSRCHEPWRVAQDREVETRLSARGIPAECFEASVLFNPELVLKADASAYRMFTPYFRHARRTVADAPRAPIERPHGLQLHLGGPRSDRLEAFGLLPRVPWYREMGRLWNPGEQGARHRLEQFVAGGLRGYATRRDYPAAQEAVSRLSPHLHFGEISPQQVWHAAASANGSSEDRTRFLAELGWREFSYYLLHHCPELPERNLQPKFDRFPWRRAPRALRAWQQGRTGVPFVDAGMRELWQTGYMHNRVRMIAASFLTKNLLIDWRLGARWFWDTLVDADLASNSASWQWVAGTGTDAAPYFRIFNPISQGRRFDPEGDYVRRYVPELSALPARFIHEPWSAPPDVLAKAGVDLGRSYPLPIIDLRRSRERALGAFSALRTPVSNP
jgi:deoxyribodipyrimidine photo-lyase